MNQYVLTTKKPYNQDMNTRIVFSISCPDRPGIVYAVTGLLASIGGNIIESQQFSDPHTNLFFLRIEADIPGGKDTVASAFAALAKQFDMKYLIDEAGRPLRTIIMVSKEAHCLQELLYQQHIGRLPLEIVGVVGNHNTLEPIANFYSVPFHLVEVDSTNKTKAESDLLEYVDSLQVELVVLARYMQILSDDLCEKISGKIINIHHSFLPSFKGAKPYHQAHNRGVKIIGATAHYVTADLDEGPIIEQDVQRVNHSQNEFELVALGREVERRVLTRAVRWHAEHRVLLSGTRTVVFA